MRKKKQDTHHWIPLAEKRPNPGSFWFGCAYITPCAQGTKKNYENFFLAFELSTVFCFPCSQQPTKWLELKPKQPASHSHCALHYHLAAGRCWGHWPDLADTQQQSEPELHRHRLDSGYSQGEGQSSGAGAGGGCLDLKAQSAN
jgi:hypothetical protein